MKSIDCPEFIPPYGTRPEGPAMPEPSRAAESVERRAFGLTVRQADVLGCMLQGMPNKLISRRLGIAPGTVKIHVSAILRALHVQNRTEAVVVATRPGFTIDVARAARCDAGADASEMMVPERPRRGAVAARGEQR